MVFKVFGFECRGTLNKIIAYVTQRHKPVHALKLESRKQLFDLFFCLTFFSVTTATDSFQV